MPTKCKRCTETAPDACSLGLCGRCCDPPCAVNIHKKLRRVTRGVCGRQARLRAIEAWKVANKHFRAACRDARCGQLSSALGISKNEIRRALLRELIAEARFRREQWSASHKKQMERDEIAALGASLLARHVERNEMVDDLFQSGDPFTILPTSDFGPGSDFVPDWSVDSESDNEQTRDVGEETAESRKPTSSGSDNERSNLCIPGLPLSRMPVGWGGALPGIAVSVKATTQGESSSACLASQQSGTSDQAFDSNTAE